MHSYGLRSLNRAISRESRRVTVTRSILNHHASTRHWVAPATTSRHRLRPLMTDTNVESETNRAEKTLEKFWEKVGVSEYDPEKHEQTAKSLLKVPVKGHVVTLDSKPIKTPTGHPLVVPLHKHDALVHLIAQEWSVLPSLKIKQFSLPLTSLAARAVDLAYSAEGEAEKAAIIKHLMPYLDTDTLLVFSPEKDCEGALREAQFEHYLPVKELAEKFWGVELKTLDTETMLFGSKQDEETQKKVIDWINSLDTWQLSALERVTTSARSLISGMLIVTKQKSVDEVAILCDLETIHQTKHWGEVEDSHDVQHADIRRLLGSASLVV